MRHQVTLNLRDLLQNSQDYGTNDDHLVSVVRYEIVLDGQPQGSFESLVRQSAGGDRADILEVGLPPGYGGPIDHQALSRCIESYFRSQVGAEGRGIRITGGSAIMRDNRLVSAATCSFEVTE